MTWRAGRRSVFRAGVARCVGIVPHTISSVRRSRANIAALARVAGLASAIALASVAVLARISGAADIARLTCVTALAGRVALIASATLVAAPVLILCEGCWRDRQQAQRSSGCKEMALHGDIRSR